VSTEPVTLDNCAREPIHIPGSIQPHGVLLACSGDDAVVTQVSANVEAIQSGGAALLDGVGWTR